MKNERQQQYSITTSLTRNTFFNFLSQVVNLGLAFLGIPIVAHRLGHEEFGLLALLWGVIGYFSLLDFGISRANTKFLSEIIATNNKTEEQRIIWTSLFSSLFLGILSALIIFFLTPFAVNNAFTIPVDLRDETSRLFILVASCVPFMLLFGTFKGFQMALQRFDQINLYQIGISVVQWGGSIALVLLGYGLTEIILLTVISRIIATVSVAFSMNNLIPGFYKNIQFINKATFKKIWVFGSWVTISQIISPLYLYFDRIIIGMFLTLNAIAYYSIPQEALTRLLVVTMSFTTTLFPVLSNYSVNDGKNTQVRNLYSRSIKYLSLLLLPLTICFIIFSQNIIEIWLGAQYSEMTNSVFQIMVIGLYFNSIAQIPNTVLHAFNRPDLPAKFHLVELPVMIGLNIILIPIIGIKGAAIVWSMRVFIDAVLHLLAVERKIPTFAKSLDNIFNNNSILMLMTSSIIITIGIYQLDDAILKTVLVSGYSLMYFIVIWRFVLDDIDKTFITQFQQKLFSLK